MKIDVLEGRCLKYELVGSRVTCDPAPTDTDQDVLVLTSRDLWEDGLGTGLAASGFEKGGSDCGNQVDYLASVPNSFQSFTCGELNMIVTFDPEFYKRFLAATGVAKMFNLLSKDDRVMLFQAVLYANDPRPLPVINLPHDNLPPWSAGPPKEYLRSWWVNKRGCVETMNEQEARELAAEIFGTPVTECLQLPYPASPRLNTVSREGVGVCPSFCFDPGRCKGHSSCPQRYSCTE